MPPQSQDLPCDPLYDTDASDLRASTSFSGDAYSLQEDVTRGVSMAAEPLGSFGGSSEAPWNGGFGVGDFYREPDNVTRGVSMVAGPQGEMFDGAWKGAGDFYSMPEDPHRGVSMASNPLGFVGADIYSSFDFPEPSKVWGSAPGSIGGLGSSILSSGLDTGKLMDSIYGPGPEFQNPLATEFESRIQGKYNILNDSARFPDTQRPPPLPTDQFFALEEATTLRLSLSPKFQPCKIGNDLLEFLDASVAAAILKVNPIKFTVKANVFIESRMCTIKARVYHTSGSEYALEVQRRSGDAVVFNTTFQKAAQFFHERCYFGSTPPAAAAPSVALTKPPMPPADEQESQPMLDMAAMEELPSLQAEAAAALAEFVAFQPSAASASICCQDAFEKIRRLLQSDKQDIAYPTAQLLVQLAKMSSAGQYITDDSFTQLIVDKVCSKESSLLVKAEFTKVVNTVVQNHGEKLSSRAKDSITAALGKTTGPGPASSKLGPELQTSAMALVGGVGGGAVF
mmetsp:Transcript_21114/g.52866  ORF Transcript_21114/g.52866 Transcript_21114/m.52866 type:complete len:511 (-) Transcript_21114:337-1869(-)